MSAPPAAARPPSPADPAAGPPAADRHLGWLAAGVLYSAGYLLVGWWLRDQTIWLVAFRTVALLVPPLLGVAAIVRRRRSWTGCHWLFWVTIALGLAISAVGFIGWTLDELLLAHETSWLGWHAVFALFGASAPLFALLAQPHRGAREPIAATTAVDIAGIAVLAGYLYSYVVMGADVGGLSAQQASVSLVFLSEVQQLLVLAGLAAVAVVARRGPWRQTYLRLAVGAAVGLAMLTLSNQGIWEGEYRSVFVYDFTWILPFFFFPWAVAAAPASPAVERADEDAELTPSRPWVIFGVLALLPVIDYGLRLVFPVDVAVARFRDMSTAVTIVSVLPLLMARLAVERSGQRAADVKARLLASAIEQTTDLVLVFRGDGRIVHANIAFCRAVGYRQAELALRTVRDVTAEHEGLDLEAVGAAAYGEGAWRRTVVRRRRDGTTFLAACVVVPMFDTGGRLTHFASVERDVTEDTRLRERLMESERRHRALFDHAPLGIVRLAADGRLVQVNESFARMLGFTEPADVEGTQLGGLAASATEVADLLAQWAVDQGAPVELEFVRHNGRGVGLRMYGRRVRDDADTTVAFEAFAEDVTRQRVLEDEVRHAQKMDAIGRLAGGVAHDFNNQLTVILGYTNGLLAQIDSEKPMSADLDEIRRAALGAAALTRRLLAFSRRQLLKVDVQDPNGLIERFERTLTRMLGEDVKVETLLDPEVPRVRLDALQFEQVLLNLALNARDAMPAGGQLTLETTCVELVDGYRQPGPVKIRPGRYAMVAVSDNGCGMDAATRARAFEPFFTTKGPGRGTGLGLATAYGIVKQLSGYIWVYSEPDRGTTVKIYLPEAAPAAGWQPQRVEPGEPAAVGSETILLVEDEDNVRRFAGMLLRRHGYRVLEAETGEAALAIAASDEPIALVLTDVVMPGLSGPEMMVRLRGMRPMKAVYMSGYTERVLRDGVLQSQAEFLEKPFGSTELLTAVRRALDAPAEAS
jgi:PAS domain S-box-containing protein